LSYVDADAAMIMLKQMGFNALLPASLQAAIGAPAAAPGMPGSPPPPPGPAPAPGEPPAEGGEAQPDSKPEGPVAIPGSLSNDDLPLIIRLPSPSPAQAGLVGGGGAGGAGSAPAAGGGQFGLSMTLGATSRLTPETIASPPTQIVVMYNPLNPEQFARVRKVITEMIDRPARQILVECMVLEISREGLDELGVRWEFNEGTNQLILGALRPGVPNATSFNFNQNNRLDTGLAQRSMITIQALVRANKAEILSRPSILTLDGRQATIRVGTDIPIATSKDASSAAEARVSFSFNYLPTGIQLNVRPRADESGKEVSMLIDATVSATVANQDLRLVSPTGAILASAPTIATRRVQT